jgi:predicted nucleic acid-binding protein
MSFVLDSSVTLAWVYSNETTEAICEVFARLNERGAWVPGLWRLEVANVLEMGFRRGRHDGAFRTATLADLALLPLSVDLETDRQAWSATVHLAERHKLTMYDAAYLELAQRRGLPLATLDMELRSAADAEGVILLGKSPQPAVPPGTRRGSPVRRPRPSDS